MLVNALLSLTMITAAPVTEAQPVLPGDPDKLAEEAYALFAGGEAQAWRRAGRLLLRAAQELGPHPRSVTWTLTAARAMYAGGDSEGSRAAFELAGQRGVAVGAVKDAAMAYASAAALTAGSGDRARAELLLRKAELLSLSPDIEESVRQSIVRVLPR